MSEERLVEVTLQVGRALLRYKASGVGPAQDHLQSVHDLAKIMEAMDRYRVNAVEPDENDITQNASELEAEISQIKADVDAMSELGEMESLALQAVMDRMSKAMILISNVQKKLSDTASQISQNLK